MKKKSSVTFGPGASSLILIFVVLAMSVLGMLSLMNSRNDIRLSERSAQVAEAVYALQARAEENRAQIAAAFQETAGMAQADRIKELSERFPQAEWDGETVSWKETDGFRTIDCALLFGEEGGQWIRFDLNAETEDVW